MFTSIQEVYTFLYNRKSLGIRPGLDRMEKMLAALHYPERTLKAIHIAGTNGKGSTLTYMKQYLMETGNKVGSFISPSLGSVREHIFLQDEPISEQHFLHYMNMLNPIINELDQDNNGPTEFEIIVMIAILYFKDYADLSLLEVGMGGEEDSTNIITPVLSIITNIGLDHTHFLGNTIQAIASQKAGIIKENVPIVTGVAQAEAIKVIKDKANKEQAPLYQQNTDFNFGIESSQNGFSFVNERFSFTNLQTGMKGKHQIQNAALAIQALSLVDKHLDESKLVSSLMNARLRGRFELIKENPTIILDGAHNTEGIKALMQTLKTSYPNKSIHLLFAAFQDKPIQEMIEAVQTDLFESIALTTFHHPRAASVSYLKSKAKHMNIKCVESWSDYLDEMIKINDREEVIVVSGSLEFISKVRTRLVQDDLK